MALPLWPLEFKRSHSDYAIVTLFGRDIITDRARTHKSHYRNTSLIERIRTELILTLPLEIVLTPMAFLLIGLIHTDFLQLRSSIFVIVLVILVCSGQHTHGYTLIGLIQTVLLHVGVLQLLLDICSQH
jgi:hypothetical protein